MATFTLLDLFAEMEKLAKVKTELQPHQKRVVERIQEKDQPGLVVAHGLGSGKTLTSIAAQDALGMPADVVVPASLQENYRKEIKKHTSGKSPAAKIHSLQNITVKKEELKKPMAIVDEAHRLREHSTSSFQHLKGMTAKKRLLLTGSPFYNHPADIAPLIDLAADRKVLPFDRDEFTRNFIAERVVKPSLVQRGLNFFRSDENKVKPGTVPILYQRRAPELRDAFKKWVDYHPGKADSKDYPEVTRENVKVPMTREQLRVYDTLMDQAPAWVALKVKRGLPPDKREAQQLNTFLSAARQATNTTAPFVQDQSKVQDPKIQTAFTRLQNMMKKDPETRAVVYSNFLGAGVNPYKAKLDEAKIPYGEFTGEMSKKKRDELVRQYNEGKIKTLLLSSAGGEGLDLKGTRLMQILEPHWNKEKLKQVEGRGIRFKSHEHLSPKDRKVLVESYLATRPEGMTTKLLKKVIGRAPDKSVDEYLAQMSQDKENLIEQFRALLPNYDKEKKSAAKPNSKQAVTERSRELASSLKPQLAAFGAYTLPAAIMGMRMGENLAAMGGAGKGEKDLMTGIGGAAGLALGANISHMVTKDLIRQGKEVAKQALKTPTKEMTLREGAGKLDWAEAAKSTGRHVLSDLVFTGRPLLAKAFVQQKVPVIDLAIIGAQAVGGGIGSAYLDKYRKMIAVNELDNVRKQEAEKDQKKLNRLRKQVSQLEVRVEGDGWKAPEKPKDAPKGKDKKRDW